MPRKAFIGTIIIAVVALFTYSISTVIGAQIVGGKAEWSVWRESNVLYFFLIWIGSVVVISLPVLWVIGRRLEKTISDQEKSVAAAKGVGRFAMKALRGDVSATDKLFDLLDDPSVPVRCQSARALAILDKREVDKELYRQVRYWQGNDKMALINTLKTTHDFRAQRLMQMLANDRNPVVARRAQASMFAVTPRTSRVDNIADSLKKSRKTPQQSVGLGEQSVGQRRAAGAKPSTGDQASVARQAGTDSAAAGADRAQPKKRLRPTLPSMAPGDRAARAAARQEAARGKRAARDAVAADDRPPLRKKSADVAPRPASGNPAARSTSAARPTGAVRPASGKPAARPAAGAPPSTARPAAGAPPSAARPAADGSTSRPAQRPASDGAPRKRPATAARPSAGASKPAARPAGSAAAAKPAVSRPSAKPAAPRPKPAAAPTSAPAAGAPDLSPPADALAAGAPDPSLPADTPAAGATTEEP